MRLRDLASPTGIWAPEGGNGLVRNQRSDVNPNDGAANRVGARRKAFGGWQHVAVAVGDLIDLLGRTKAEATHFIELLNTDHAGSDFTGQDVVAVGREQAALLAALALVRVAAGHGQLRAVFHAHAFHSGQADFTAVASAIEFAVNGEGAGVDVIEQRGGNRDPRNRGHHARNAGLDVARVVWQRGQSHAIHRAQRILGGEHQLQIAHRIAAHEGHREDGVSADGVDLEGQLGIHAHHLVEAARIEWIKARHDFIEIRIAVAIGVAQQVRESEAGFERVVEAILVGVGPEAIGTGSSLQRGGASDSTPTEEGTEASGEEWEGIRGLHEKGQGTDHRVLHPSRRERICGPVGPKLPFFRRQKPLETLF